jgi:hypothetical protein
MGEPVTAGAAAVGVAKEIGFKVIEAGIGELKKGDVIFRKPDKPVGVSAENMPEELRLKLNPTPSTARKVIWTYRSQTKAGIEAVNIKLICEVQYNGPEVQAVFDLPADGMRSRLGSDTTIEIQNPLSLQRLPAPPAWKAAGFKLLPVVHVPISIFVDEPWPNDNTKATFNLVLSGLYGLGTTADGSYYENYQQIND